jgi:hypothetical protein
LQQSPYMREVASFADLIATPFSGEVNAVCWRRHLAGDFQEVINRLPVSAGITSIDDDDLRSLRLTSAGAAARDVLLADQALLRDAGLAPTLDCITGYPSDETAGPVATDVYSFHVDRAPVRADTFLCTYAGASSQGLPNAMAKRRVDVPETRAALLQSYGGADDAGFAAYLHEQCYDLHYIALPGAAPFTFGLGALWRIAIAYPDSHVPPCIHRAPRTLPGDPARLLLIS